MHSEMSLFAGDTEANITGTLKLLLLKALTAYLGTQVNWMWH
jgi:hypothetical protein